MTARFLIGTSGWNYPHWRGRFYPPKLPQREWLAFYAQRFPTVEINNTFYRLPRSKTFAQWRRAAPARFVFGVKASRYITHIKRLRLSRGPVTRLLDRARRLERGLGPILFQLPPNFGPDEHRLADRYRHRFSTNLRSWRGNINRYTRHHQCHPPRLSSDASPD